MEKIVKINSIEKKISYKIEKEFPDIPFYYQIYEILNSYFWYHPSQSMPEKYNPVFIAEHGLFDPYVVTHLGRCVLNRYTEDEPEYTLWKEPFGLELTKIFAKTIFETPEEEPIWYKNTYYQYKYIRKFSNENIQDLAIHYHYHYVIERIDSNSLVLGIIHLKTRDLQRIFIPDISKLLNIMKKNKYDFARFFYTETEYKKISIEEYRKGFLEINPKEINEEVKKNIKSAYNIPITNEHAKAIYNGLKLIGSKIIKIA